MEATLQIHEHETPLLTRYDLCLDSLNVVELATLQLMLVWARTESTKYQTGISRDVKRICDMIEAQLEKG